MNKEKGILLLIVDVLLEYIKMGVEKAILIMFTLEVIRLWLIINGFPYENIMVMFT